MQHSIRNLRSVIKLIFILSVILCTILMKQMAGQLPSGAHALNLRSAAMISIGFGASASLFFHNMKEY
jgi:hypothetical protein